MRRAATASVLALLLSVSGCGNGADGKLDVGGDLGFVAGSGAVTMLPVDGRGDPVDLKGRLIDDSGDFDLGAHRGKVVLINIWGSWCAPCRGEAPELQGAWDELKDSDVQFVGLNTKDDAEGAATAFERRFGITYPSVRDTDGQLQLVFRKSLPPSAIPSTIVLDKQGRVAASVIGGTTRSTFTGLVEDLLAEA
jgi:thiol-disulfide isomerase/thioredoxin